MQDSILSLFWFTVMAVGGILTLILGRYLPYVPNGLLRTLRRAKKQHVTYCGMRIAIKKRYSLWTVIWFGFAVVSLAWVVFIFMGGYDVILFLANERVLGVILLLLLSIVVHLEFGCVLVAFALLACFGREECLVEYCSKNFNATITSELSAPLWDLIGQPW